YMFWVALGLLRPGGIQAKVAGMGRLKVYTFWVTGLVVITALSGGFVAGLKAGFAYNTFPLMGDSWIPQGIMALEPAWKNLFENVATVQFNHRLLAELLVILIPALWWQSRKVELSGGARIGFHLLLAVLLVQVALGISTLLMHVHVHLAVTHQAGALVLLTVALFVSHEVGRGA
ncbi:MAG: heme A synthase, partial [Gammaproteobacteria bacterium]|nr:heme A synthase [Gammaproteobacteria bacterium]